MRASISSSVSGFFASVLLLAMGCSLSAKANPPQPCTQMGCASGITVTFEEKYRWKPGSYVFDFLLDQRRIHCRGKLPFRGCDSPSIRCDASGVLIEESGCALEKENHAFGRIQIESLPKKIEITIMRDSQRIGKIQAEPQYKSVTPNGPACEPSCIQAQLSFKAES